MDHRRWWMTMNDASLHRQMVKSDCAVSSKCLFEQLFETFIKHQWSVKRANHCFWPFSPSFRICSNFFCCLSRHDIVWAFEATSTWCDPSLKIHWPTIKDRLRLQKKQTEQVRNEKNQTAASIFLWHTAIQLWSIPYFTPNTAVRGSQHRCASCDIGPHFIAKVTSQTLVARSPTKTGLIHCHATKIN